MKDSEIVRRVFEQWISIDKLQEALANEGDAMHKAGDTQRQAYLEALSYHVLECKRHITAALSAVSSKTN